jgi:uncharacterized glyoxalase superfamily protein PhnB
LQIKIALTSKEGLLMYKGITTNLMVESVEESISFYRDTLGFSLITSVPSENGNLQFAILTKDGLNLMFQERGHLIKEYPILTTDKTLPSVTLYISVDNFEELYIELKNKCKLLSDVHETFYGSKEFAVADNNGYVLTFTEHKAG